MVTLSSRLVLANVTLPFKYLAKQGVIQEFAVEAVKHELGISNNRADGFGGLYMSKDFPLYGV